MIVFSANAAARVESTFGVDPGRIFRSPVGCEHWERDLGETGLAGLPDPRPTQDILVLGAIRRARFPEQALAAFDILRQRGTEARLLFVGRPGDAAGAFRGSVAALKRRHGAAAIRWIDVPDEARMPRCVAGAALLLHLAKDEASPVTPLEATRMGLPVVASKLPAFQEVLGQDSWFVSENDPTEIAAALESALAIAPGAGDRRRRAEAAKPFTWEAAARAHCAAWKRMLGHL